MRRRRLYTVIAALLPFAAWLLLDLVLRLLGAVPPDDAMLRYRESFDNDIEVFVPQGDDYVIRSDWLSDGDGFRSAPGGVPGQFVIYPGFRPARIARHKDPRSLRIFVLGDSTAFGLGVGPRAAFAGVLEERIGVAFPDRRVEVINLGCPGWASSRVAALLRSLIRLQPDLFLVYSSHNEMLGGRLGDRPELGKAQSVTASLVRFSPSIAWARHWLSRTHGAAGERLPESAQAEVAGRSLVYDPLALPEADRHLPPPALATAAADLYKNNLCAMVESAHSARAPILFLMPVSNLMIPPAYSAHAEGFQQTREFQTLLEDARREAESGRAKESLEKVDQAIRLSPEFAMSYYWRGSLQLEQGLQTEARASFQAAIDRDVRTHRITSALEHVLIDTAESTHTPWVDLRPVLQEPLDVDVAKARFIDFCHPTAAGHRMIADTIAPEAIRLLRARAGAAAGAR